MVLKNQCDQKTHKNAMFLTMLLKMAVMAISILVSSLSRGHFWGGGYSSDPKTTTTPAFMRDSGLGRPKNQQTNKNDKDR